MIEKKKVVIEGCNGEWSQLCYLPVLLKNALEDEIDLWLIDIEPKLVIKNQEASITYNKLLQKNKIHYINKLQDTQIYNNIRNMNYVFIVTPDRYHSKIALFWLDRMLYDGKVFIEKPLDSSLDSATLLKYEIYRKNKLNVVYGFDHYIAKIKEFLNNKNDVLDKIGDVRSIQITLCESSGVIPGRVETLQHGIILDIYCHVLSLLNNIIGNEFLSSSIDIIRVETARYYNSPINEETFAFIHTKFKDINIHSIIGKNVDYQDNKQITITGTKNSYKLNLIDSQNKISINNFNIVQDFINSVFLNEDNSNVLGIQEFDHIYNILEKIEAVNVKRKFSIFDYDKHDSIDIIANKCNIKLSSYDI